MLRAKNLANVLEQIRTSAEPSGVHTVALLTTSGRQLATASHTKNPIYSVFVSDVWAEYGKTGQDWVAVSTETHEVFIYRVLDKVLLALVASAGVSTGRLLQFSQESAKVLKPGLKDLVVD